MKKLDEIYEYVNGVYGLDISKKTQKREYVDARALFCLLAREKTTYTLGVIGNYLGKDHTTILHALKNLVQYLDKEIVASAFNHFGLDDKMPKDTIAYLRHKLETIEQTHRKEVMNINLRLLEKERILDKLPRLEVVYKKMYDMPFESRKRIENTVQLQFDKINKHIDNIETAIDIELVDMLK